MDGDAASMQHLYNAKVNLVAVKYLWVFMRMLYVRRRAFVVVGTLFFLLKEVIFKFF